MTAVSVTFVITGLEVGGAELMLLRLLGAIDRKRFAPAVVSLAGRGSLGGELDRLGIPVLDAAMRRGRPSLGGFLRLRRILRAQAPQLVQGWMYHANLLASMAGCFSRARPPVLWNIRASLDEYPTHGAGTRAVIRAGARLSRMPAAILYNSFTGARQHERFGYSAERTRVIPNGIDTESFRPSVEQRSAVRAELELAPADVVLGLVARDHPVKDPGNFLQAARRVLARHANACFVMAGSGFDPGNERLAAAIAALGLAGRVRLLGPRGDVARLFAAFDVAVSSSLSESFPNAVGEAMACGVPCVVTDVGDCAQMVGDTGAVVPPRDDHALAEAVSRLIALGPERRARMGAAARERVIGQYSLPSMVRRYEEFYLRMLASPRAAPCAE